MKNRQTRLLKWFVALCVLAPVGSCATSEPIDQFDQNGATGAGTGGTTSTGGTTATGGTTGTGGVSSTGGTTGTGGISSTGGTTGTGGIITSTGGQPGTGGAGGHGGAAAGGHAGAGVGAGGHAGATAAGGRTGGGGAGGASATFAFVSSTLMASCGGTTCHNGSQSVKFLSTSASTLYTNLTTMTAPDCMKVPLVTANDTTKSALYLAITKMCGGNVPQMPDGKPALPTATITAIQQWIMAGAPQQ
jgi:hypothetical protein